MLQVETSVIINAVPSFVTDVYLDYNNWHNLFPLTIRGAKLIKKVNGVLTVEVDHRTEGLVINILTILSKNEIRLIEFKPKYNAIFINRFDASGEGTIYTVIAHIALKGIYKIASPFVKGLVLNRVRKFVLEPMKKFAENKNVVYKVRNPDS